MLEASIVLLVKNEINYLPTLFAALEKQKNVGGFEVVVVDSGSTDGSQEFLAKKVKRQKLFTVRLYRIKPQEFGYSKTRNFAVKKAKGKIIVFLTAHALPCQNNWLKTIITSLNDKKVAAVFNRLIPYPNTSIYDKYFCSQVYPDTDRFISQSAKNELSLKDFMYFSNVSGAIRKDILEKIPFDDQVMYSEDQWWAKKAISQGYQIKYLGRSKIMHSHNFSLAMLFRHQFISGYSLIGFKRLLPIRVIVPAIPYLLGESFYLLSKGKIMSFIFMIFYEGIRYLGFVAGMLGNIIPAKIRNKLLTRPLHNRPY